MLPCPKHAPRRSPVCKDCRAAAPAPPAASAPAASAPAASAPAAPPAAPATPSAPSLPLIKIDAKWSDECVRVRNELTALRSAAAAAAAAAAPLMGVAVAAADAAAPDVSAFMVDDDTDAGGIECMEHPLSLAVRKQLDHTIATQMFLLLSQGRENTLGQKLASIFAPVMPRKISKSQQRLITEANCERDAAAAPAITAKLANIVHAISGSDEVLVLSQLHAEIQKLHDRCIQVRLYKTLLRTVTTHLRDAGITPATVEAGEVAGKATAPIHRRLLNTFVECAGFLCDKFSVKFDTDLPEVDRYVRTSGIHFFDYAVRYMPSRNSFPDGFVMDEWQRVFFDAIRTNKSALVLTPPGAGKTLGAMGALFEYDLVFFAGPTEALVTQIIATAMRQVTDLDKRGVQKNLRSERPGHSYQRLPQRPDNIVIGTPKELLDQAFLPLFLQVLHGDCTVRLPNYLILDEVHIRNVHYELMLFIAGYLDIPVLLLSGTVPNAMEVHASLARYIPRLALIEVTGRYTHNVKTIVAPSADGSSLVEMPLDPLRTLTCEMLPSLVRLDLDAQSAVALARAVSCPLPPPLPPRRISRLEIVEVEQRAIAALKAKPADEIAALLSEDHRAVPPPTLAEFVRHLQATREQYPTVVFHPEGPHKVLHRQRQTVAYLQSQTALTRGPFKKVRSVLRQARDAVQAAGGSGISLSADQRDDPDALEALTIAAMARAFHPFQHQLDELYAAYLTELPTPEDLAAHNACYGDNLTLEDCRRGRRAHLAKYRVTTLDSLMCAHEWYSAVHPDDMLVDTDTDSKRKIAKRFIQALKQDVLLHGRFPDATILPVTYADYAINATLCKKHSGKVYVQLTGSIWNHPLIKEFIEIGSLPVVNPDALDNAYLARLFRVFNPIAVQLLGDKDYKFVLVSDESLATGFNSELARAILVGGLHGEPASDTSPTLLTQAAERVGRRGFPRPDGKVTYLGTFRDFDRIISKQLTPVHLFRTESRIQAELALRALSRDPRLTQLHQFMMDPSKRFAALAARGGGAPATAPAPAPAAATAAATATATATAPAAVPALPALPAAATASPESFDSWEEYAESLCSASSMPPTSNTVQIAL